MTFNASGAASALYEMDDDALITSDLTLSQAPGLGDVTLNVGDRMQIIGGGTVSVFQGSDVTAANLDLAISSSNGTMIVDGGTVTRGSGSGVLQRGCDRLWRREEKPRQIVFVANGLFSEATPELTQRVADHLVEWMTSPLVVMHRKTWLPDLTQGPTIISPNRSNQNCCVAASPLLSES